MNSPGFFTKNDALSMGFITLSIVAAVTLSFAQSPYPTLATLFYLLAFIGAAAKAIQARRIYRSEKNNTYDQLQHLREILEHQPNPLIQIDQNAIIHWANTAFANCCESTPGEMVGQSLENCIDVEDASRLQAILQDPTNTEIELRLQAENGARTYALKATPMPSASRLLLAANDITEKNSDLQALKKKEEDFRLFTEEISDGILILHEGKVAYASQSVARITGISLEALQKFTLSDAVKMIYPEDRIRINDEIAIIRRDNIRYHRYAYRFLTPTQGIRWIESSVTREYDSAGNTIRTYIVMRDISDQKMREQCFQRNQQILARTEAVAHIGSWEWDVTTDTSTWSSQLYELFGVEIQERAPSFSQLAEFFDETAMANLREVTAKATKTGQPYTLELQGKTRDGEKRHFLAKGYIEKNKDDQPLRLYGSFQDITERKTIEQELRESMRQNRAIVSAFPDILLRLNDQMQFLHCQAKESEMLHMPPEKFLGKNIFDVLPETSARKLAGRIRKALDTWEIQSLEYDILTPQNKTRYFEARVQPLIAGEVLLIAREVTEKKNIEKALQQSEEQFRALAQATPTMIAAIDNDERITFWNPACETITGYTEKEMLKNPKAIAMLIPDKNTRERFLKDFTSPFPEENQVFLGDQKEIRVRTRNGEEKILAWANLPDSVGLQKQAYWGAGIDITPHKKAIQKLKQTEQRYRTILETLQIAVFVADPKTGRLIDANTKALYLTGYSREDLQHLRYLDLHPTDQHRAVTSAFHKSVAGAPIDIQTEIQHKDGQRISISIHSTPPSFPTDENIIIGFFTRH